MASTLPRIGLWATGIVLVVGFLPGPASSGVEEEIEAIEAQLEVEQWSTAARLARRALDAGRADDPAVRARLSWLLSRALSDSIAVLDERARRRVRQRPRFEALEVAEQGLAWLDEADDPSRHRPLRARLHAQLGRTLLLREDPEAAVPHLRTALASWEAAESPGARREVQRDLARALRWQEDFEEELTLRQELVASLRSLEPPRPADLSREIAELAATLSRLGDRDAAREAFEESLALHRDSGEEKDLSYSITLANYASLCRREGDLQRARELLEEALVIRERRLDPLHPELSKALNNLANVLMDLGEVAPARRAYERAIAIDEEALGPDSPNLISRLINLAILLTEIGDLDQAVLRYERALRLCEIHRDPDDLLPAQARLNFGATLALREEYGRAETVLERAVDAFDSRLGSEHYLTVTTQLLLASAERAQGHVDEALARLEPGIARLSAIVGEDHPDLAYSLRDRALLRHARGEEEAARVDARRALRIYREALGDEHPYTAAAHFDLALLLAAQGVASQASEHALRAEGVGRRHLQLTARALPERQALAYARSRTRGLDLGLSLMASASDGEVDRLWDALVRSRALVLEELAVRHRAASRSIDPALRDRWAELGEARRELANLGLRGPRAESPAEFRSLLQEARRRRETAERALAEASLDFRLEQRQDAWGLADVRRALPAGSALVAFVRYRHQGPGLDPVVVARRGDAGFRYAAFVLDPAGRVTFVDLGSASPIDERIAAWREELRAPGSTRGVRRVRLRVAPDFERYAAAGAALREKIYDPLVGALTECERVFVVPDGQLHLVGLGALPAEGGGYLVERHAFHYLTAERALLHDPGASPSGEGLLAVGGARFDRDAEGGRAPQAEDDASDCRRLSGLRFAPLEETRREAREVAALWRQSSVGPARLLTGGEADERAVKQEMVGRRALHLATHGFALPARCEEDSTWTVASPLVRCGLALAGANRRSDDAAAGEDGILTAEEIVSIDLRSTETVVLSACGSGLGWIESGEGVLGLRRSFELAGARTVVSSLWSVDDRATRAFMAELYRALLERGRSASESVHQATLSRLRAQREQGAETHPFSWGAFVASGDWR